MKTNKIIISTLAGTALGICGCSSHSQIEKPKNIVLIYLDDLGYGDVSAYGAKSISTPNMDKLANEGVQFTRGYATSSTSTPSRYGILTGEYPWRNKDARILDGIDPLIIDTAKITLPKMLKEQGYYTGLIGKWHLGLGDGFVDWNERISLGPNEVGFDYAYHIATTQDRVPTVYIKNGYVDGLEESDPLYVSYEQNFEGEPTGYDNPELLTLKWDHDHHNSIVNGISRIGYMKGGVSARWSDIDMADDLLEKGKEFIKENKDRPFFMLYAMQQPHVPRTPNPRFVGKSGMGARGDAILEADWAIGELIKELKEQGQLEQTLIIFSSDNGPVLNDGYCDEAVELLGDHKPAGEFRGGKYSLYEAGTRVPFAVYWKGVIEPKVSDAMVCQLDFYTSLAHLVGSDREALDSENYMDVFLGKSDVGRESLILEASGRTALRMGEWVMIPPYRGSAVSSTVKIELGNSSDYQLYNLKEDKSQANNLAKSNPEQLELMKVEFDKIKNN